MFRLQTDTLFIAQSHVHRALYIINDAMVFERAAGYAGDSVSTAKEV